MKPDNSFWRIGAELLLLLCAVIIVSKIFPWDNYFFPIPILWLLIAILGYLFGEFDPIICSNFGFNLRTQGIILSSIFGFSIISLIYHQVPQFNLRFWAGLWVYLNLIAPILGFVIRRLFPIPVVLVTDQNSNERIIKWWGYNAQEQVIQNDFNNWLKNHSDNCGRIFSSSVFLIDTTNKIHNLPAMQWADKYFAYFILIKSYHLKNYLAGTHIKILSRYPGYGINYRVKRFVDVIFSLLFLFLSFPLFLLLIICIKVDSPGPIFYRHRRLGKHMKPFYLLKFRTMFQDADQRLQSILASDEKLREEFAKTFKLKNDPRITRIGKYIRQFSIDELPQFINVLKGDMSLVGPRPIVEAEIPYYQQYSLELFRVLPGVTGLWQISGRTDTGYENRVKLDTEYVRNWSYCRDLMILLKTIPAVISQKGAY